MNGWLELLRFQLRAKKLHGVHSPFIYEFQEKVLLDQQKFPEYLLMESLVKENKNNKTEISFHDHGAKKGLKRTTIGAIAAKSGVTQKYGRLLFRISRWFQPQYILELGTSLGFGTSYLALGAGSEAHLYTIEGGESIAEAAIQNFKHLKIQNKVESTVGSIEDKLPDLLNTIETLDLVYFDANHRYVPTLQYFEMCLTKVNERTIFIFDDINWSVEMQNAWKIIQDHPRVSISIDIYRMGIVFFRKNIAKEHFVLKF